MIRTKVHWLIREIVSILAKLGNCMHVHACYNEWNVNRLVVYCFLLCHIDSPTIKSLAAEIDYVKNVVIRIEEKFDKLASSNSFSMASRQVIGISVYTIIAK